MWCFIVCFLCFFVCICFSYYPRYPDSSQSPISISIIPNSVHSEARFRDTQPRNTAQELVLPPVNLDPALLVVRDGDPLVAPVAGADGVAVPAARGRGVQADLPLNVTAVVELEGGDVARHVEAV